MYISYICIYIYIYIYIAVCNLGGAIASPCAFYSKKKNTNFVVKVRLFIFVVHLLPQLHFDSFPKGRRNRGLSGRAVLRHAEQGTYCSGPKADGQANQRQTVNANRILATQCERSGCVEN